MHDQGWEHHSREPTKQHSLISLRSRLIHFCQHWARSIELNEQQGLSPFQLSHAVGRCAITLADK